MGALFWKTIAKGDGFPEDNKYHGSAQQGIDS